MDWQTILAILGGIVVCGNAGAVVYKLLTPALELRKKVESNECSAKKLEEHSENDFKNIQHLQEVNKLQCEAMLCIINHMIDGNHTEQMKKTRDSIQKLLVEM